MDVTQEVLSDITVHMKYARYNKQLQRRETWEEIVDRNKNMHISKFPHLKEEIENAYQFVYDKKVLPSMRSLQFGGAPIELNNTRIFNCSFLPIDDYRSFSEAMFLLLSGCGVGFSVQQHHIEKLPEIKIPSKTKRFLVNDSIEGWSDAIRMLCKAYFTGAPLPLFDFRDIRPKGAQPAEAPTERVVDTGEVKTDDTVIEVEEEKQSEKLFLPPYPDCLFELTPEQQKYYEYTGDMNDLYQRMRSKLWLIWNHWGKFRNNEKTIELVQKVKKEDEDAFHVANELVNMIDVIGRILKSSDITEELFAPRSG